MPARPRGKPFAGVVMDDVQFAELVAIRTAWEVRQ
jgi:hypothetical protein